MKNANSLNEWIFDKKITDDHRFIEVSIHFIYPAIEPMLPLSPAERKKSIGRDQKHKLKELLSTALFNDYQLIGQAQSPRGLKTTINLAAYKKISSLDYIASISISNVTHATKQKPTTKPIQRFYCVKMTVAIEIEKRSSGLQTIEERLVIIKAKSHEDAYRKLEKKKDSYAAPYLNSDGHLVRWRIESFDDCYETDIVNINDFGNPEGVEVYSKLSNRRLKKESVWNGE